MASATNMAMIIQNTQGMVDSIGTCAMRQETMRFTASGG